MERENVNLQRLYWKTDKERILQIMQHLNPKYLVGLYEKLACENDEGFLNYCDERVSHYIPVKYDGCQFTCSRKQLRKELVRRGLIKQSDITSIYPNGTQKKIGEKEYKDWVRVEQPNGRIHFEKAIKSGKELRDIEHETKHKKV